MGITLTNHTKKQTMEPRVHLLPVGVLIHLPPQKTHTKENMKKAEIRVLLLLCGAVLVSSCDSMTKFSTDVIGVAPPTEAGRKAEQEKAAREAKEKEHKNLNSGLDSMIHGMAETERAVRGQ